MIRISFAAALLLTVASPAWAQQRGTPVPRPLPAPAPDALTGLAPSSATINVPDVQRRAAAGDLSSMMELGLLKLMGEKGVAKDTPGGIKLLRDAIARGHTMSAMVLAVLETDGVLDIPANPADAVKLYQYAFAHDASPRVQGMAAGKISLAYRQGRGVAKDEKQAVDWSERGAKLGDPAAMAYYGLALFGGNGVTQDRTASLHWLTAASDAKQPDAMAMMGTLYVYGALVPKDEAKGVALFIAAADQHNGTAAVQVAARYGAGAGGLPRDDAKAFRYATIAASAGSTDGQSLVATFYREGVGTTVDLDRAAFWARKSAEAGNDKGMVELVLAIGASHGQLGTAEDARKWLEQAAAKGNSQGQSMLGGFYEHGWGGPADRARAVELYRAAAAKGEDRAKEALVRLGETP